VPDGRLDLDILPSYVFSLEVLLRVLTHNLEHHMDGILEVYPRLFACAALGDGISLTCKQSSGKLQRWVKTSNCYCLKTTKRQTRTLRE
jgi:hypothetical protein